MDVRSSHNQQYNGTRWSDVALNVAGAILDRTTQPLAEKLEEKKSELGRKIYAGGFIFIGLVLLLIGLSVFLNQLFNEPWIGYALSGALSLLIGIITKSIK